MKIGYARVSTIGQDHQLQVAKLEALGVDKEKLFVDAGFTGKNMTREGIRLALAAAREGDELVIPEVSRLGRNTFEVLKLVAELEERGIALNVNGNIYDPRDPMGKLFFTMMAAVAEAEGGWVSIRTTEAMARPEVRARLKGKKPKLSVAQHASLLRQFEDDDVPVPDLAHSFGISRAGVYRALERARAARSPTQDAGDTVATTPLKSEGSA